MRVEVIPKIAQNLISNTSSDGGDFFGFKAKINEIAAEMHRQSLLTPDPNDDKIDFVQYLYNQADSTFAHFLPDAFREFSIYCLAMTNQMCHTLLMIIFKKLYEFVTEIVLFTPEWLFDNSWFPDSVFKFSVLSGGIVIIFSMIEGIKRILKMSHTPLIDTVKKVPIALGISASAPYIFSFGVKTLNKLTHIIVSLASSGLGASNNLSVSAVTLAFQPFDLVMIIGYIGVIIYLCVPLFLLHARRWFDLLMSGLLTPLAMSAWLFKSTEKYFQMWLRNISNLIKVQLFYATFVAVLGILMFGTPTPTSISGALVKGMVEIGGIYRLAFPPQFITQLHDGDFMQTLRSGKTALTKGLKLRNDLQSMYSKTKTLIKRKK